MNDVVGDFGLPKNLSFHGKSGGMGCPGVEKIDVELFSVGGERTGSMGTLFVQLHEAALMDSSRPEEFTRCAVQAKNALGLLLFVRGGQNHPIPYNDGRTVPASGNFRLPNDVL